MSARGAQRALVLVQGSLGERLTGPEIRGWETVRALGTELEVTAAAHVEAETTREGVRVVPAQRRTILRELREHDAIVGPSLPPYALLAGRNCLRVADLYDPGEVEMATLGGWRGRRGVRQQRAARRLQVRWADVLVAANERQMEALRADIEACGRTGQVPALNVPMGLPAAPPAARGHALRDRFEAIGADDPVVLWWGSVWRWLDAHTAVEAVEILARRHPDIRLVITAGRPPNAATDPLNVTEEVRAFARDRGLLGRNVLFLDEWVPYEQRHLYLADADLGITLHADDAEAALAARARYMDCIWASLPLVLAEGDEVGERLGDAGAATLVAPRDPAATAAAIESLIGDPARLAAARAASARVAAQYHWPNLLAPLVQAVHETPPSPQPPAHLARASAEAGRYYLGRAIDRGLGASYGLTQK